MFFPIDKANTILFLWGSKEFITWNNKLLATALSPDSRTLKSLDLRAYNEWAVCKEEEGFRSLDAIYSFPSYLSPYSTGLLWRQPSLCLRSIVLFGLQRPAPLPPRHTAETFLKDECSLCKTHMSCVLFPGLGNKLSTQTLFPVHTSPAVFWGKSFPIVVLAVLL